MADITMCVGYNCEHREKCYRYTAPINKFRQSVFTETPEEKPCQHFWDNENKPDGRKIGMWWTKLETDAADTKEKALEEDVKRALVDLFIDLDAEVKGGGGTHDMDKIEQAAEEVVLYVIYAARKTGIEV